MKGMGQIKVKGRLPGMGFAYDALMEAMEEIRNPHNLEYLKGNMPVYFELTEKENREFHSTVMDHPVFLSSIEHYVPHIYNATIALGLSSCHYTDLSDTVEYFDRKEQLKDLMNHPFVGASGTVIFDNVTGTRTPESALFSLTNFVGVEDEDGNDDKDTLQLRAVETDLFIGGEWTNQVPYTFNDGMVRVPPDIPSLEPNNNYLIPGIRALVLVMCALAIIMVASMVDWVYLHQTAHIVLLSQTIFLFILCGGFSILAASIAFLSVDEAIASQ